MKNSVEKLNKLSKNLQAMKAVEAKVLATDSLLPFLRTLVQDIVDNLTGVEAKLLQQDEAIESLAEAIDSDPNIELLQDCRDVVIKLASLVDETMLAAGFLAKTDKGLVSTGKAPGDLADRYATVGAEAVELVADIEEQINAAEDEDDDGPDGDSGEPVAADDNATVLSIVAVPQAAGVAVAAIEPDVVEPAAHQASGAASAAAVDTASTPVASTTVTTNTEHDTDAA